MKHIEGCGVCGNPLIYSPEDRLIKCNLCGREAAARIYCPQGHYVCDDCHRRGTQDLLRKVLSDSRSTSPLEILELIMSNPAVPLHGPEHHILVPAIIVTAAKNAGYAVPEKALEEAIKRGSQVPGGWCGLFGDCGAAVGVGIAVSVLTRATPLTGKPRTLALRATSEALQAICDDGPRCCKRSSRQALETAIPFLDEYLGFPLDKMTGIVCTYTERNKECIREACPYFPGGKTNAD
jgi:7,8-dihydro-6-hydroxymethylpterin dimethyltransferase